jgi:RND family efflux transporter MFP subunit
MRSAINNINKTGRHCLALFILLAMPPAWAAEEIAISSEQAAALGIVTAPLPDTLRNELAGLPAQVVIPDNQVRLITSSLAATVDQVLAGVGDSVKKGQVLARLQSPALAEAQRGLLEAATQAQLARDDLARDKQLWQDGIIAERRYRATRSLSVTADAALAERKQMLRLSGMNDAAIAQLQASGRLDSLLAVAAPIAGVVLERSISAGQKLDAAAPPMFKIAQLNPLALEIQAPLAATDGLAVGAAVTVPAAQASGKLIAIGRSLSGSNQTVLLRALIQHGTENLRAGQFVEASIATKSNGAMQWEIPNSALARINNQPMIFVATAQGFRAAHVTVLHEGAQHSVIGGAFNGSEKIAMQGVSALKASLMNSGAKE